MNKIQRKVAFDIIGQLSLRPSLKAFKRIRQTQRIPLHEAAYNGHSDVISLLVNEENASIWQLSFVEPISLFPGQNQWQNQVPNIGFGMSAWRLHYRAVPMTLKESFDLGKSRYNRYAFRQHCAWDYKTTMYDDTWKVLERLLFAASERQHSKRLEHMGRKAILRETRHEKSIHMELDEAILRKDFATASSLLDKGAFPDYAGPSGLTVLMQVRVQPYILNKR